MLLTLYGIGTILGAGIYVFTAVNIALLVLKRRPSPAPPFVVPVVVPLAGALLSASMLAVRALTRFGVEL